MSWQDYVAVGLVAAAAMVVGVCAWKAVTGKGKTGCGSGCGSCGSANEKGAELLTIGEAPVRPK